MMLLNAVIAEASIGGNLATALTSEKIMGQYRANGYLHSSWFFLYKEKNFAR